MSTAPALPDLPPYHLQHLLSNVNELLGGSRNAGHGTVEVRCAQALGSEIYVGCSNGSLLRYAFVDSLESSADSYQLLTHQSLPSGKPIDRIALAPSVEKALVLCDGQLQFFTLPNLEPVQQIKPFRRVVTFALDEGQQRKPLPERRSRQSLQSEPVRLCVIKPTAIGVYSLHERLLFQKEIPFPNGATMARLSNNHLCVADSVTYNIIDLDTASLIPLIPLSQAPDASDAAPVKPSITIIDQSEFLLLSWTGTSTLGVFIAGGGDPVRGTLAWETHPVALSCDYPYVTSVLPNGTIEVQNLDTQAICQTIPPPPGFTPTHLETSFTGFVAPFGEQLQKIDIVIFPLLEPETPNTSAIEDGTDEGLQSATPKGPPRGDSLRAVTGRSRDARQPKASVLAVGADAVYAIVTPSFIQQADALLDSRKLKETAAFVKERQKSISQLKGADLEQQTEELHYVYQRLGYTYLSETIFEDAGNNLFRGNVDPRMLIRLFSGLRGTLLVESTPALPVFSGIAPYIRALGTVDAIIVTNLVKNYTPHLQPNTRSAPPTSELRKLLMASAREMLRGYLHKWKNKVKYGGEPVIKEVSQAIDTVLVKLLAEGEDTQELYELVESSEDIVAEEVEETLIQTGQYNALIKLYQRRGNSDKLLTIWSRLVEGEWTDEDVRDPLGQMTALLNETRDRSLVQRWGLWLVKRDVEAGLKLLMSVDAKRGAKADDAALLEQLEGVSSEAGEQFLQHLVLQKHSSDPKLHTRLANVCLDRLLDTLKLEETLEYFRDIALEYSIQDTSTPFLVYLASASASSPQFEHVRTRCRAALFLQGSALYDAHPVREKLNAWEDVLGFELAILDGKLGTHTEALKALVHTLRDTASADAYCALGGCPIPPKVAQLIGDQLALQSWAALVVEGPTARSGSRKSKGKTKENLEQTREQLLKVLLEVYMSGGEATEAHAARLLNSQGGNLDVLDVVSLVPPSWSLQFVSSFLERSLRRTVHERCESEILKAVCLGQNLEVRDNAYLLVHAQGAVIEEPVPGSQSSRPSSDGSQQGEEDTEVEEGKVIVITSDPVGEKVALDEVQVSDGVKEVEGRWEGVRVVDDEVT